MKGERNRDIGLGGERLRVWALESEILSLSPKSIGLYSAL